MAKQKKCPKCGRTFIGYSRATLNGDGQEVYQHQRVITGTAIRSRCVVIVGAGLPDELADLARALR